MQHWEHYLLRLGPHPQALLADARPASGRVRLSSNGMAKDNLSVTIRLLLRSSGPEARSSRGGGAPRERAGVGPRPQTDNADWSSITRGA